MACLFNTWHFPATMVAAWKTPSIFSPINFRLAPGEVALHIDDSKPAVLIWDSAIDATLAKALEMARHRPQVLLATGESQVAGAQALESYIQGSPEHDDQIEARLTATLDPFDDEILRHYTSGTTGQPKGTIETSAVLLQMDWSVIASDNLTARDRMTNVTPWFHQGGIVGPTTMLALGGEVYGLPLGGIDAHHVLDLIAEHHLTSVWGAPVIFDAMAAAQRERPRDVVSMRMLHTMGSPFSRAQFEHWSTVFPTTTIKSTYGTTETRGDIHLSSDADPMEQKAGSAGLPGAFCRVRLVAIRPGEQVEPDELVPQDGASEGQVISKSPYQFLGYFGREELNAERIYKGWFYSGDIGTWDSGNYITIMGRTDDMIQSGAEKVYPVPVEEALLRNPKVADCVVVGLPHPKWGQAVASYIVPKDGEELSVEELDTFCRQDPYLADYTRPRYYCIRREALPYTATGKKVHYRLQQRAEQGLDHFEPIPSEQ